MLHKLLQKAAMRLRNYSLVAGALSIQLKYLDGRESDNQIGFDATSDTLEFLHMLASLWAKRPRGKAVPLRVSVTLSKLHDEKDRTLPLFGDSRSRDRLNAAIDRLNLRYEKNTVYFCGAQLGLRSAPMRIAFNHIPDLKIESDE